MEERTLNEQVTRLLDGAAAGDGAAASDLLPLVYQQLRASAQRQIAGERAGHTLQATALVHEAYVKLVGPRQVPWQGRGHFYAAAAEAMRRVLIDHARSKASRRAGTLPSGGDATVHAGQDHARMAGRGVKIDLDDLADVGSLSLADSETIVAVEAAMQRLEQEDPEAASVVRLRFYAGLSVEQTAEALGMSPRSAARVWNFARAALFRLLSE